MTEPQRVPILAVLGKGGVGKTVISALLARALIDRGRAPLLLIDADPAEGLAAATGLPVRTSLAEVGRQLLAEAGGSESERQSLADELDYHLLQALAEGDALGLLAMGASLTASCFCPLNRLLRLAMDRLSAGFAGVVVDAEAGLEQVQRQVFDRIDVALLVCDGSLRAARTAQRLGAMLSNRGETVRLGAALNRTPADQACLPEGLPLWLEVPEDEAVASRDRQGRSLLHVPAGSAALGAVGEFVDRELLGLIRP